MALKEVEQQGIEQQVEQKYIQVKKELAELKAVLKKQEESVLQESPAVVLNPHEATDLYIERKDDNTKQVIAFEQGNPSKVVPTPKKKTKFDVTPGKHTLVDIRVK